MYRNTYHATPRGGSRRSGGVNHQNRRRTKPTRQSIHPSKFIRAAKPVEMRKYAAINSFADFAMHELLKENVARKGFTMPSEIQDQAVPFGLKGRDVVGIADTGTGKTTAFALPLLHRLITEPQSRALIIAPTRELAEQIEVECRTFAKGSGLYGALLIGGAPLGPQIRELQAQPSIVIGTPGRIKDHLERSNLSLENFNIVVLDEVDRMVDMGFIADIQFLLSKLAQPRQSLFFSATIDGKVQQLIRGFLNDPITVSVKTSDTSSNVDQDVVTYRDRHEKIDKLHELLIEEDVSKILVFDDTQRNVEQLSQELAGRGFKVDALHGGKTQGQRQRALKRFRSNEIKVLVATDVAARGIDISDISHVINYSIPNAYEDYVHRIGRAGRAGRTGKALTFIALEEMRF